MEGENLAPKGKNNYVVSPKAGVSIRGVNSQFFFLKKHGQVKRNDGFLRGDKAR